MSDKVVGILGHLGGPGRSFLSGDIVVLNVEPF